MKSRKAESMDTYRTSEPDRRIQRFQAGCRNLKHLEFNSTPPQPRLKAGL
jgi:hypothetical protein